MDTFAPSIVSSSASEAGAAAAAAEARKLQRYADISKSYHFVPVAVETAGTLGQAGTAFLRELGHRLMQETGDKRELGWLIQRISVAVMRGDSASITQAGSSAGTAAPVSTPTLASTLAGENVPQGLGINAAPLNQPKQTRSEENMCKERTKPLSRRDTPVSRLAKYRPIFKEMAGRSPRHDTGPANESLQQDASPSRDTMADPELAKYVRPVRRRTHGHCQFGTALRIDLMTMTWNKTMTKTCWK